MDELENAIKSYSFTTNILCMSCKEEVKANDCETLGNGIVLCPKCGKDICEEA